VKLRIIYGFSEPYLRRKNSLTRGEKQLKRLGGTILDEEVIGIDKENVFHVKTAKNEYQGNHCFNCYRSKGVLILEFKI